MWKEHIVKELVFKTSRSGGPGGQNVNKVETKVLVSWDIMTSNLLDEHQKDRLIERLGNRINKEGLLQLESSETKSQRTNKELATLRLTHLIENALQPTKKRIPSKIPKSKIIERLDRKKKNAQKKQQRKKPNLD